MSKNVRVYRSTSRALQPTKTKPTRAPQLSRRSPTGTKGERQPNNLDPISKGGLPQHRPTIDQSSFRKHAIKPRATAYSYPTSSFAGGTSGTSIFGSGLEGDSLLKAYYDTVIKPLAPRGNASKNRPSSSSCGKSVFQYNQFHGRGVVFRQNCRGAFWRARLRIGSF